MKRALLDKATSGPEQVAEKGRISREVSEKHPAGAEARVDFAALTARLKSCPVTKHEFFDYRQSFFAACEGLDNATG
jgi:hypothetical protein